MVQPPAISSHVASSYWLVFFWFRPSCTPRPPLPATNPPIIASVIENSKDSEQSGDSDKISPSQFRKPVVFDSTVQDNSSWHPSETVWNWNLLAQNILPDFSMPQLKHLHWILKIWKKGRSPQFWTECCLFNLQDKLLVPVIWPVKSLKEDIIF